jgi:hypothetical protein
MELAGVYIVFLALWDKLAAHDRSMDKLRDGAPSDVPSALCQVQTLGQTVGSMFYEQQGYKLQAGSLGEVFETLNIAHPDDYRRRSLSVGDVVVDPHGTPWVCQMAGWKKVVPRSSYSPANDFAVAATKFEGDLEAASCERRAALEALDAQEVSNG